MKAEIVTIGDELLIGQTIDTNSAWIGKAMNNAGFFMNRIVSVSDSEEEILDALSAAGARVPIVLITGGLGPTKDDITKEALCKYFHTKLVMNREVLSRVEAFFRSFNRPMLEANMRQAELPENCTVLPNEKGTASGMWFEKDGTVYVSMPGVPYEMEHLMEAQVLPRLKKKFTPISIVHKTIMTQGIGESFLAEIINDWESGLSAMGLKLAYLPSPGMVKLRISAYGGEGNNRKQQVEDAVSQLYNLIPGYIYGEDEEQMEETVGKLLKQNSKTLGIGESCTGGYISHLITTVPGSSLYYKGSVTTYSNEMKTALLNIDEEVIRQCGVVSTEVAELMAVNARELLKVDYAIATTGMAGPSGGSNDVPVGTVCFAVAGPARVVSDKQKFGNDRLRIIERSTKAILNLLRKELLKDFAN